MEIAGYVADTITPTYVTNGKKTLNLRGVRQPPDIALRDLLTQVKKTFRTPAPPIHSSTIAHVRTTTTGAGP